MDILTAVVGNDIIKQDIICDIISNRFHHSYIIEGKKGSGRKTLVLNTVAALCCESKNEHNAEKLPCLECPSCRRILNGKTTDVSIIRNEPDKVTIGVEVARYIKNDSFTLPNDFKYKVYIIDNADTMTPQAQNALLLTLEEPHSYALFFLICESADNLLETIRSRSHILRMSKLDDNTVKSYICNNDERARQLARNSDDELNSIIKLSDGNIGKALELLDEKSRKPLLERRSITKRFVEISESTANNEIRYSIMAEFPVKRDDIILQLSEILKAFGDIAAVKKSENYKLQFYNDINEVLEIANNFSLRKLYHLCAEVDRAIELINANANVKLTLTNLLM